MKERILVVDDEAAIRDLLEAYLQKHGYQVTRAGSAPEALTVIDEVPIKLVILDVLLGEKDGLELLGTIKAQHPNLPVIIITGMGYDEELLQEALDKGASGYISKTLPLDQLLMEVHRTLNYR